MSHPLFKTTLLLWIISLKLTESSKMIVFYGQPEDPTTCILRSAIKSWDECVDTCFNLVVCTLATGNNDTCRLCTRSNTTTLLEGSKEEGVKIAIKADSSESSSSTCPSIYTEIIQGSNRRYEYNITYSDGKWVIKYYEFTIPPGWILLNRNTTFWGLKMFNEPLTYWNAQKACEALNATLTGVEDLTEWSYIASNTQYHMNHTTKNYKYSTWLGLEIKPECNTTAYASVPGCKKQLFRWTDPYVKGTEMLAKFSAGRPQALTSPNDVKKYPCGAMLITESSSQLYDQDCNVLRLKGVYEVKAYACGIKPYIQEVL